jgi:predicted translin family RNA/ssDNA-binding protein
MSKLTPEQISNLIKEEDENKEGNILIARKVAQLLSGHAKELVDFLDNGNVRGARAVLAELSGEIDKISEHIDALANSKGLVDLKVP